MPETPPRSSADKPLPVYLRRPGWVETMIDARFKEVDSTTYSSNGISDDYTLYTESKSESVYRTIAASKVIDSLTEKHARQLRILDIGAGYGAFVLRAQQAGHQAHGLSAEDYREIENEHSDITKQLEPGSYIIGDANRLNDIPGVLDEYDLIVSKNTFQHLTDPIGTLEQTLDKVAVGGKAMIGQMNFMARSDLSTYNDDRIIFKLLNEAGFETEKSFLDESLHTARVSRQDSIRFPVEFTIDDLYLWPSYRWIRLSFKQD